MGFGPVILPRWTRWRSAFRALVLQRSTLINPSSFGPAATAGRVSRAFVVFFFFVFLVLLCVPRQKVKLAGAMLRLA